MFLPLFFIAISSKLYYTQQEEKSFISWMRTHGHFYSSEEYHFRLGIYLSNSRLVKSHNLSNRRFKVKLNKFACLTPSEYRSLLGFRLIGKPQPPKFTMKAKSTTLDWRTKGVVNAIKDQGNCGSCWAFSCIQTVESIDCIFNGGPLLDLSEQSLVDCNYDCFACSGGNPYVAISYIVKAQNGKFNLQSEYPYEGVIGNCRFDDLQKVGSVSGYVTVAEGDEDDLAGKVENNGPASVSVDASSVSFQLYDKGIYDERDCKPNMMTHSIGCVGYGIEGDTKYWIVRNSWGTSWGEEGYMRLIWENNMCGIATMAVVALP